MIYNRKIALSFRVFCFLFSLIGILAILKVFNGKFEGGMLMYYTLLSNILVMFIFGFLAVKTAIGLKKDGTYGSSDYAARFVMICSVDIFLTFVVYWAMLVPQSFSMTSGAGLWTFANLAVHAITPILCFVDYFLFTSSHHLKYKSTYATLIFPIAYWVVMSIVGMCGYVFKVTEAGTPVHYPYFFFDYDAVGFMAAVYIVGLIAIFIILNHLLYWLDKKWNKKILFNKPENKKARL